MKYEQWEQLGIDSYGKVIIGEEERREIECLNQHSYIQQNLN